ncbi:unnamed protein product [Paramecium sonneborni]|uniref:Uncharacterized protein n=1 Tax=Paramecium sonneborni TaxID=65129 RepID=A0A8S1QKC3_9CILI|nr:unnamed protein product [Paramecium sonneborni]
MINQQDFCQRRGPLLIESIESESSSKNAALRTLVLFQILKLQILNACTRKSDSIAFSRQTNSLAVLANQIPAYTQSNQIISPLFNKV